MTFHDLRCPSTGALVEELAAAAADDDDGEDAPVVVPACELRPS